MALLFSEGLSTTQFPAASTEGMLGYVQTHPQTRPSDESEVMDGTT